MQICHQDKDIKKFLELYRTYQNTGPILQHSFQAEFIANYIFFVKKDKKIQQCQLINRLYEYY
jgi:hypothetical protein